MEHLKIILVDDNKVFRESMKELLSEANNQIIAEAGNGEEFLMLPRTPIPDVILMDIDMPKVDGYIATKTYFMEFPNSKIIAVTNHVEKVYLKKLIETGFKGCVFKYNIFDEIIPAIQSVIKGKLWFPSLELALESEEDFL